MAETVKIDRNTLLEITPASVSQKTHAELISLCLSLANYCRDLFEKNNRNSRNSSIPPSTFIPGGASNTNANNDVSINQNPITAKSVSETSEKKPRKQRDKGYGRTIKLIVSEVIHLYPLSCDNCKHGFSDENHHHTKCCTAYEQVDLVDSTTGFGGLIGINRQTKLYQIQCTQCQAISHYQLSRQSTSEEIITLTPWRIIGSKLSSVICYLKNEAGMSYRKIQHALSNLFGISLSLGVLCQNIHETGLSAEPITEVLKEELQKAEVIHADETSWTESKKHLWLWVFTSIHTCLFLIGGGTKKMAQSLLKDNAYQNWLMSDGYLAYRDYDKRFRCWAHLERKFRGLNESAFLDGIFFGEYVLKTMVLFKDAIYKAREANNTQSIKISFIQELEAFKIKCQRYVDAPNSPTAALAKEFLNDWDAIFLILDYPHYPLTNNLAERALRHWVIIRKIIQGTRTAIGSKTTAIMASITATCNIRKTNIIDFVQDTVTAARQGKAIPLFEAVRVG